MTLRARIGSYLRRKVMIRSPDLVIGEDYLLRWYLIPRNRFFNIYVHLFLGSDTGRDLHDHPWINLSWILENEYREEIPYYRKPNPYVFYDSFLNKYRVGPVPETISVRRKAGDLIFRWPSSSHRQHLAPNTQCLTLFFTGPVWQVWGFWTKQGKIPYKVYLGGQDASDSTLY